MTDYELFLEKKQKNVTLSGFDIDESELNDKLFPFQKFCVKRALKAGKYGLFEDCGLGKTVQQLEWSHQVNTKTGKPVLILCPLAVAGQTIKEGKKFGIPVKKYDGSNSPIQITNYDQLENIDTSIFGGIVLDECFAPDTKIQVWRNSSLLNVYIKDCQIGDKVLNCTGIDTILSIKQKKIPYAIKIKYNGAEIVSSPKHPYFTNRGWVPAKNIRRGDVIISTDQAMRILRGEFSNTQEIPTKYKVLRDILFSEMENEATGTFIQSSQPIRSSKTWEVKIGLAKNGCREIAGGTDTEFKPNEQFRNTKESFSNIKGDGTPTFNSWGEWSGDDITTAINEGCIVRKLDSGICHIYGQATKELSNKLQSRFSEQGINDSNRSGWSDTPQPKGTGQKEGRYVNEFRVESFEVLEQADSRLDKYRDATGSLYFYDLEIKRHPSFTINGGLVHNSSILKNFEGATKNLIIEKFKDTPYKLACTATPSPNDPMELGNHSEFLDVMSRNEMLAMYFVHDGGETAKWRLKGHAVKLFYQFIGTWAIMLNKPQDIGFEMKGYALPKLNIIEHQIKTGKRDNGQLFNDAIISATNFNAELRLTKEERLNKVVELVNQHPDENFIIWIKQNEEGEILKKLLPEAIEVKGADTDKWKEDKLLGFANNDFRILISKTKIASFGMNYQNCRNQIFASLDFSFEGLYQAIRRSYRFGQKNEVNIHLITTDTMANVNQSIRTKQKQFETMQEEMANAINQNLNGHLMQTGSYDIEEESNRHFKIKRGDCVQLIKELPNESIGLSVFSPPFAELYTYSSHVEDMGNSKDYNEFLTQFGFLIKELYRVLISGRNVAVHCMDLPIQKGKEGFIGLRDFSGMILSAFQDAGFVYASRVTIWKDPVVEMQRTKALGLLHKQIKKDSTMSRVGIPDYVMIFRKDGERNNPVTNTDLPVDLWQKYASPVWMDIDYGNTLQGYRNGRDEKDEKHICPLQLDTIERLIHLYSNKGDTVFTPFMGIGSEVYQAIKMGRIGIGYELKESYFDLAKKNVNGAVLETQQLTLI